MKKVQVYFDGGIRPHPNGGFARCYGWLVKADGVTLTEGRDIEIGTDDIGSCAVEFEALTRALQDAASHVQEAEQVEVRGDSAAVIDMCVGTGNANSAYLAAYKARVGELANGFSNLTFAWIPRELNGEADKLGRIAFAESSRQEDRMVLMDKVNVRARRKFGNFYDKMVMSVWCEEVTGKRKLTNMSVGELGKLLGHIRHIPNFIRDYVARCDTVAQTDSVCF